MGGRHSVQVVKAPSHGRASKNPRPYLLRSITKHPSTSRCNVEPFTSDDGSVPTECSPK
jgi:hypothetical protein